MTPRHSAVLVPLAAALAWSAPLAAQGLRGDASMRVEVEVYKGPAGQSAEAQVGQLNAVIAESARATRTWLEAAKVFLDTKDGRGCIVDRGPITPTAEPRRESPDCAPLRQAIESGEEIVLDICQVFPSWIDSVRYGIWPWQPSYKVDGPWTLLVDACRVPELQNALVPLSSDAANAALQRPVDRDPTETKSKAGAAPGGEDASRNCPSSPPPGPRTVIGATRIASPPSLKDVMCGWEEITRRLSTVATSMKSKAIRAADANVAFVPRDPGVRSFVTSFAFLTGEYANQIEGRLAVLVKLFQAQKDECARRKADSSTDPAEAKRIAVHAEECERGFLENPTRARTLPMSDYLRNADNGDMLQLYDWLNAASRSDAAGLGREGRIAMARRLTADHFWQKINEVYASGQGDVAMAFIKDDLGNWNLKSFSNDPQQLLAAYRGAANAALKAVVKVAGKAVNPVSGAKVSTAQELLGLANQLATGEAAPAAGPLDPTTLHARALARLVARREDYATRQANLTAKVADAERLPEGTEAEKAARTKAIEDAKAARDTLAEDARTAAQDVLDDQLAVIAALQEAAAPPPAPAETPATGAGQ